MSDNINFGTQTQIQIITCPTNSYNNGPFVAVFQVELGAVAESKELKLNDLRVLLFMMASVDSSNCIITSVEMISRRLDCATQSVYRALRKLEKMHILCHQKTIDRGINKYELTLNMINPRLAYHGNTRKLMKQCLPLITKEDGKTPLISGEIKAVIPEFLEKGE